MAEVALRILAPMFPLSLQAVVREEAYAGSKSALRVARGTQIILREADFRKLVDLVFVGDSMVFGSLVSERELFSTHLTHAGWSVLNLGIGSTGPCAYNHMLQLALSRLPRSPSVVFYVFFANDVVEGSCVPIKENTIFIWEDQYHKSLGLRFRRLREWLLQRSVVYQIAKRLATFRGLLQADNSADPIPFRDSRFAFLFAPPSWWQPQVDLTVPMVAKGFAQTCEKILLAKEITQRAGTRFILMLMPFKEQVYVPQLIQQGELASSTYDHSYDLLYDKLLSWARENHIAGVDLRPIFRVAALGGMKLYWTLDGHLTSEGHRIFSEALRHVLGEEGVTPQNMPGSN